MRVAACGEEGPSYKHDRVARGNRAEIHPSQNVHFRSIYGYVPCRQATVLVDPILARDASHTTERKSTHATMQATMAQAKDVWNQDRHGESLDVMSGEEITQIYRQCRRRSPFHFAKQVTLTDRIFE